MKRNCTCGIVVYMNWLMMTAMINEHLSYLIINRHGTSSFLVTNAQFPEEIRRVPPVTQFYISVDGSTKEGLKKLDRPLFRDYWDRFNACVGAIKERVGIILIINCHYNFIERTNSVAFDACEGI